MKKTVYLASIALSILLVSCGGKEEKKDGFSMSRQKTETVKKKAVSTEKASTRVDLESTGVGPVSSISLGDLDQGLADKGKEVFEAMKPFFTEEFHNPSGIYEKALCF